MIEYNICTEADEDVFKRQCRALEKHIPGLHKERGMIDVDGTAIQPYTLRDKQITVFNDIEVGAVYIQSEIPLEGFFSSSPQAKAQAV